MQEKYCRDGQCPSVVGRVLMLAALLAPAAASAKFSSTLQGQSNGSTNWIGNNLQGWHDWDYIPMRVYVSGGPATSQAIKVYFDHYNGTKPGVEDLSGFTTSANVTITAGPDLNAPLNSGTWYYTFTINLNDRSPGYVEFRGRLAAGGHLNPGSSLHLGGDPTLSTLQIAKPAGAPGTPDLALFKHGPAQAAAGSTITYTILYTNKVTSANDATLAQVSDVLPPLVSYVTNSASGNATLIGNSLYWDIGSVPRGASGTVTYKVKVHSNATDGQTFANYAQIFSAEDDANYADNLAQVTTTVENGAPVANDDVYTVNEDSTLTVAAPGVLANDTDPDNSSLTAQLVGIPAHGTLSFSTNGAFVYTPSPNFNGADTFSYKAIDDARQSAVATVTISVRPVNNAPVAANDAYVIDEDTLLSVAAPGVLANDTDVDGDHLTAILMSQPSHGSLSFSTNGAFIYSPATNYNGADSFTYQASDGQAHSGVATVSITIRSVNDAPVAVNDVYTINEDTLLVITAPGVLLNDVDVDGDQLTSILVTGPAHGSLTLAANGGFVYLPSTNYHGPDSFSYKASDGQAQSGIATVSITVQPVADPPVALDDAYTLNEDSTLTIAAPGVLSNDSSVDGDSLTATLVTQPAHGTVTLSSNGGFVYTPNANFHGLDLFTYKAHGATLDSASATVKLTVNAVNGPPSFAKGADQLVNENAPAQSITNWATNIIAGSPDEAGQTLTFIVVNDTNALFSVQPAISPNGTLTYTPATNAYGVAHVTVVLKDNGGTANGGVDTSAPQMFIITVNSPPLVAIVQPTNNTVFIAPADVTVIADAHDLDGTISQVRVYQDTNSILQTNIAPYLITSTNMAAGTYQFTAEATDNYGAKGTSSPVNITVLSGPPLLVIQPSHFNPQTGLFEERVRILNPTPLTLSGARLLITNLAAGVQVFNATGATNGMAYVQTLLPIPAGGSSDLTIEYYVPNFQAPNPSLSAEVVPPSLQAASNTPMAPVPITRKLEMPTGEFLLEFNSLANRTYFVEYSDDMKNWKMAWPTVRGTGNRIQWLDNGAPRTESAPMSQKDRFYRVMIAP